MKTGRIRRVDYRDIRLTPVPCLTDETVRVRCCRETDLWSILKPAVSVSPEQGEEA